MEYRELKSTNIADYEAGDILELANDDDERFVAIVVKTNWICKDSNSSEENGERLGIYDLDTECIFEDLNSYKVIRKRNGYLQLTD